MNSNIFIFLYSAILALYLHETNAFLYKLQTSNPHPDQASTSQHLPSAGEGLMLVPTSNEKARQEFVYLFMTPPTTEIVHISMPALQILCYLRMAKIPFYALSNHFLLASPTGKPQFAQINGQIFENPNEIIKEIEKIEAEKIEVDKNKKPKNLEKWENEIQMVEEALETMQNIFYADLLTSSETKKYDGSFPLDGSSQIEMWMQDDGLKEQMFLALTKLDEMNKEIGETIDKYYHDDEHSHDEFGKSNLAKNELKFMKAYFNMKNRGTEEKDIFFVTHGRDFMHFHKLEFPSNDDEIIMKENTQGIGSSSSKIGGNTSAADEEEDRKMETIMEGEEEGEYEDMENARFEIVEVKKKEKPIADDLQKEAEVKKKKKPIVVQKKLSHLFNLKRQASKQYDKPQQKGKNDRERFEELMEKRVKGKMEGRLAGQLAKLKMSIVEFSKALSEKTIKIPELMGEEKEAKRKEEEKMEKESEIGKNKTRGNSENIGLQRVNSMRQEGVQTVKQKWGKLSSTVKNLQSGKFIRQFEHKMMENCSEDELVEAFKHAVDVLAQIVKPFSHDHRFLFHKKATATEARLLATLNHLFNYKLLVMPKLNKFMEFETIKGPLFTYSLGPIFIGPNTSKFQWVEKRIYHNKNVKILSDYFEMRRGQLGLDENTLNTLKKRPWSLERMMVNKQKYSGPYAFKINSMETLPQWAEHNWPKPQTIEKIPLDEETVGPDHKILTKILAKIAFHFWENLSGKYYKVANESDLNYVDCRAGLMHIVAYYICNGSIKLKKGMWSNKEKECSEWHLKKFYKLDLSIQNLLLKLYVPMESIIFQTVEEFLGIEDKILGAVKLGMNAQEKGTKGKGKLDEPVEVEGNFMLDLF